MPHNVVIDGSLVLIGGDGGPGVGLTTKFETVSLTKNKVLPDFSIGITGHCVTKLNENTIMVTGGYDGGYRKQSHLFNFATEQWTDRYDMNYPRSGHACGMFKIGDKPYNIVAGGYANPRRTDTVEFYDFHANSRWIEGDQLLRVRFAYNRARTS